MDKFPLDLKRLSEEMYQSALVLSHLGPNDDMLKMEQHAAMILDRWAYFQRTYLPRESYEARHEEFCKVFSSVMVCYFILQASHLTVRLYHQLNEWFPSPPITYTRHALWSVLKCAHDMADVDTEVDVLARMDAQYRAELAAREQQQQQQQQQQWGAAADGGEGGAAGGGSSPTEASQRRVRGVGRDELEALLIACIIRGESAKALAVIGQLESLPDHVHPRVLRRGVTAARKEGHMERAATSLRDVVRHEYMGEVYPEQPRGTSASAAASAAAAGAEGQSSSAPSHSEGGGKRSGGAPASTVVRVKQTIDALHSRPFDRPPVTALDESVIRREHKAGFQVFQEAIARGDFDAAHHALITLYAMGVGVNERDAARSMRAAAAAGHVPLTEALVANQLRCGLPLGEATAHCLVEAYAAAGDLEGCFRTLHLYYHFVRPREVAAAAAIASAGKAKAADAAASTGDAAAPVESEAAAAPAAVTPPASSSEQEAAGSGDEGPGLEGREDVLPDAIHRQVVGCAQSVIVMLQHAVRIRLAQRRRGAAIGGSSSSNSSNVESTLVGGGYGGGGDPDGMAAEGGHDRSAAQDHAEGGDSTSLYGRSDRHREDDEGQLEVASSSEEAAERAAQQSAEEYAQEAEQQQQQQQQQAPALPTLLRAPRPSSVLGFGFLHDPPGGLPREIGAHGLPGVGAWKLRAGLCPGLMTLPTAAAVQTASLESDGGATRPVDPLTAPPVFDPFLWVDEGVGAAAVVPAIAASALRDAGTMAADLDSEAARSLAHPSSAWALPYTRLAMAQGRAVLDCVGGVNVALPAEAQLRLPPGTPPPHTLLGLLRAERGFDPTDGKALVRDARRLRAVRAMMQSPRSGAGTMGSEQRDDAEASHSSSSQSQASPSRSVAGDYDEEYELYGTSDGSASYLRTEEPVAAPAAGGDPLESASLPVFNILLSCLAGSRLRGLSEKLFRVFTSLPVGEAGGGYGLTPSSESYGCLLAAYSSPPYVDHSAARVLLKEMSAAGLSPDSRVYSELALLLAREGGALGAEGGRSFLAAPPGSGSDQGGEGGISGEEALAKLFKGRRRAVEILQRSVAAGEPASAHAFRTVARIVAQDWRAVVTGKAAGMSSSSLAAAQVTASGDGPSAAYTATPPLPDMVDPNAVLSLMGRAGHKVGEDIREYVEGVTGVWRAREAAAAAAERSAPGYDARQQQSQYSQGGGRDWRESRKEANMSRYNMPYRPPAAGTPGSYYQQQRQQQQGQGQAQRQGGGSGGGSGDASGLRPSYQRPRYGNSSPRSSNGSGGGGRWDFNTSRPAAIGGGQQQQQQQQQNRRAFSTSNCAHAYVRGAELELELR